MTDINTEIDAEVIPGEEIQPDETDRTKELQITKIIVVGEYGDHRPYEREIPTHVLLGHGDGCSLQFEVLNIEFADE